jgi:hypothetical protein
MRKAQKAWINNLLSDDRDDIKELVNVMMDFFCIISSVQNNARELKRRITRDKLFNVGVF